jgi:hypothetical protein
MDLEGVARFQPAELARRRDQLDFEAAVIENFQERLPRRGVLELLRLLLDGDAVKRRRDLAFRRGGIGDIEIGFGLFDFGAVMASSSRRASARAIPRLVRASEDFGSSAIALCNNASASSNLPCWVQISPR